MREEKQTHLAIRGPAIPSMATFACSGYCLCKYSMINAIGFDGFSINKLSTMAMNKELMFLLFKYCCNSAWTSAACTMEVKKDDVSDKPKTNFCQNEVRENLRDCRTFLSG